LIGLNRPGWDSPGPYGTPAARQQCGAVQFRTLSAAAWTQGLSHPHHSLVRVLAHIKKLDDCFGQFLVRVSCPCGASRHIEPEALARLVGWSTTLSALAPAAPNHRRVTDPSNDC
jgi:hypothetical protein